MTRSTERRAGALKGVALALTACGAMLSLIPSAAMADERSQDEYRLILEAGAASERELSEGSTRLGPAVAVEVESIEHWLEIELGASRFNTAGGTVWNLDLPFKKPWRLSETLEVMPGIGPTWEHRSAGGSHTDTWGAEAVVDLFFWRSRRVGWFVEPAYEVAFGAGHIKSFAITAGVFVGLR